MLKKLAGILERASLIQEEFTPILNAVNALNHISRITQENRITLKMGSESAETSLSSYTNPSMEFPSTSLNHHTDSNIMTGVGTPQINFHISTQEFSEFEYPLPQDFLANTGETFEPIGYMRAVENEFIGRNWHENWWDIN